MTTLKDILKDLPSKSGSSRSGEDDDVMSDPDYVRQSSKFISEALRKGQDIMQLDNGDIVTTEIKTIITQYRWDEKKKKMVRTSTRSRRKRAGESED